MDRRVTALLVLAVALCQATNIVILDQEQGDDVEIYRQVKSTRVRRDVAPPSGSGDHGSPSGDQSDHHVGSGSGKQPVGSGDAMDDDCLEGSGSDSSGCRGGPTGPTPTPSSKVTPSPSPTCVKPSLSQNHMNLVEEDKAVQRARCHSACLNHIAPVQMLKDPGQPVPWLSVSLVTLRSNCSLVQQVFECRSACEMAGFSRYLTEQSCVDEVFWQCTSPNIPETSCLRRCDPSFIRLGCQINTQLLTNRSRGHSLIPFSTSPQLSEADNIALPGAYIISPPAVLPSGTPSVTVFVVKVTNEEDELVSHYVLGSLSDPLILNSYFICEHLNISVAAVDQFTKTLVYSTPASVTPSGDRWPSYPANVVPQLVSTAVVEDTRFGFWNHSNLTIAWHTPNRLNYTDHYLVQLASPSEWCGPNKNYSVPESHRDMKGRRVFNISAGTSVEPPLSGCSYNITILSQPRSTTFPHTPSSRKIPIPATPSNIVPIEFNCSRTYSLDLNNNFVGDFYVTVNWAVPDHPGLLNGIHRFEIKRYWQSSSDRMMVDENIKVELNRSNLHYTSDPFHYLAMDNNKMQYVIELHTIRSNRVPHSQPLPLVQTCKYNTIPLPPTIAQEFLLGNYTIDDEDGSLHLKLSWREPEQTYGSVSYILYVGFEPLEDGVNSAPNEALMWQELTSTGEQDVKAEGFSDMLVQKHLERQRSSRSTTMDFTLYVQLKAKNQITRKLSKWTPAVSMVIKDIVLPSVLSVASSTVPVPGVVSHTSTLVSSSVFLSSTPPPLVSSTPQLKPTITNDPDDEPVGGLPIPATYLGVILVVVALLIAIVVVAALLCFAYAQNRRASSKAAQSGFGSTKAAQLGIMNPRVYLDKWEVVQQDVIVGNAVGQGTFGDIHIGSLKKPPAQMRKEWAKEDFPRPTFIKFLKTSGSVVEQQEFYLQLDRWKKASVESHPNILMMLGCATHTEPVCLLFEHAEHGDLLSYLLEKRREMELLPVIPHDNSVDDPGAYSRLAPKSDPLKPIDIVTFAVQIASAMECLSSQGIVHRDLACRNIYVAADKTLKIADFGVVRTGQRDKVYVHSQTLSGVPLRWMSVEAIIDSMFSPSSDVWAFGVTLWEMLTMGDFPYYEITNDNILSTLMNGQRLNKPSGCSPQFFSILEGCWDKEPNRRPSFELLHETLLNILQQSNCSQLFDVTTDLDDNNFVRSYKLHGKPASSPTNESSDSAICEVERLSVSPDNSCTNIKQSTSTDLDSRIKKSKPVVSACNVMFIEEDPVPEMNPDGSTEI